MKYGVGLPPKMCRGTHVAISRLIAKCFRNRIAADDDIHANYSIISECINIRDDTMNCDDMKECYANGIAMQLTTMWLNYRSHHGNRCSCDGLFTPCCCILMNGVNIINIISSSIKSTYRHTHTYLYVFVLIFVQWRH